MIWHESYDVDIGPHVFPTRKYRLVRNRLVGEGTISDRDVEMPTPASWDDLARVHTREYLEKVETGRFTPDELVKLEVPFSPALRHATRLAVGGTILAGRRARGGGCRCTSGAAFTTRLPVMARDSAC